MDGWRKIQYGKLCYGTEASNQLDYILRCMTVLKNLACLIARVHTTRPLRCQRSAPGLRQKAFRLKSRTVLLSNPSASFRLPISVMLEVRHFKRITTKRKETRRTIC